MCTSYGMYLGTHRRLFGRELAKARTRGARVAYDRARDDVARHQAEACVRWQKRGDWHRRRGVQGRVPSCSGQCTRGVESRIEDDFVRPRTRGLVAALALVRHAAERASADGARTARRVAGRIDAQVGKPDMIGFAEGRERNQPRRKSHHGRRLGRQPGENALRSQ
eukprot:scaffold33957_cov91-Phaeocystis_antarctica.AAC.3